MRGLIVWQSSSRGELVAKERPEVVSNSWGEMMGSWPYSLHSLELLPPESGEWRNTRCVCVCVCVCVCAQGYHESQNLYKNYAFQKRIMLYLFNFRGIILNLHLIIFSCLVISHLMLIYIYLYIYLEMFMSIICAVMVTENDINVFTPFYSSSDSTATCVEKELNFVCFTQTF